MVFRLLLTSCFVAAVTGTAPAAEFETTSPVPAGPPIVLSIDASNAPAKIYHVKETLPATPGEFEFVYPKWIPGYHSIAGPIADVVNLHVAANGAELPWRRDLVDPFSFRTTVPAGTSALEITFDLVGAEQTTGEMETPSTANVMIVSWSSLVMYAGGTRSDDVPVRATLTLPHGWKFGTALTTAHAAGDTAGFAPVSLTTLVDSPLNAGKYFSTIQLAPDAFLDVAGDSPAAIVLSPETLSAMKHLVAEGPAVYGGRHYETYHFLLTLSDNIQEDGIEHHQSSDNRAGEEYLSDASKLRTDFDLMPHEYSHSWNGKYRRPADLYQPDFQAPEKTDLLWVYEGLNQFMGELLGTRSRFVPFEDQLQQLAIAAAGMDVQSGRTWRSLRDDSDAAPLLYSAPSSYGQVRRNSNSFYTEGDLIWLDVDQTIRAQSHGTKSIDDFLKAWAAPGGAQGPSVKTYELSDVIATLDGVVHDDWAAFFQARVDAVTPHAPLGGITQGGYTLQYTDTPTDYFRTAESNAKHDDFRYSLGMIVSAGDKAGTVGDVLVPSPAFSAGLAPGMKIEAVDGRRYSADVMHAALKRAKAERSPISVIVSNGDFFSTASIAYYDGDRYPRLVRDATKADLLSKLYTPRTFTPPAREK